MLIQRLLSVCAVLCLTIISVVSAADVPTVQVNLTSPATGFEGDNTNFVYRSSSAPFFLVNDGGAATGGFRVFATENSTIFTEKTHETTGRSKIAAVVYNIGGRDLLVNIPAPDSILRVFEVGQDEVKEIEKARKKVLGDWSTTCTWRSEKGNQYLFLFGKKKVVQFLIRARKGDVEVLEIQTFTVPIEAESCTATSKGKIYFSAEDAALYSFQASESTSAPAISIASDDIEVLGLATYVAKDSEYIFIAQEDGIAVHSAFLEPLGLITLSGIEDLSFEGGLSIFQGATAAYPSGAFAFAFEGDDATGVAVGSLMDVLRTFDIDENTMYNPNSVKDSKSSAEPISGDCSNNGFKRKHSKCECFAGFDGKTCSVHKCSNSCSNRGTCIGPNTCKCSRSWTGPDCSFLNVEPKYETDANGGDGDDPAIWISPESPDKSVIVTTTKSEEGAGLTVFNLKGELLQKMPAAEPNNVDVIYGFVAGNRTVDLAFAACRDDDTLCLFEITSSGNLQQIPGGIQPVLPDFTVYGSCAYRSQQSKTQYLFVNSKKAIYLQYALSSLPNGTLTTSLVRQFSVGTGGQVEGCVADEQNGWLFLGEEPYGLWRYEAEPSAGEAPEGFLVGEVGDGKLFADVEGVTMVHGKNASDGFLFVSSQGVSTYVVYERAPPHKYVMTFTIGDGEDGKIDHVSNTDGLVVVGTRLNADFPFGVLVTHDDANELAEGGTAEQASFKIVSLEEVLGREEVKELRLLERIDETFDPRL